MKDLQEIPAGNVALYNCPSRTRLAWDKAVAAARENLHWWSPIVVREWAAGNGLHLFLGGVMTFTTLIVNSFAPPPNSFSPYAPLIFAALTCAIPTAVNLSTILFAFIESLCRTGTSNGRKLEAAKAEMDRALLTFKQEEKKLYEEANALNELASALRTRSRLEEDNADLADRLLDAETRHKEISDTLRHIHEATREVARTWQPIIRKIEANIDEDRAQVRALRVCKLTKESAIKKNSEEARQITEKIQQAANLNARRMKLRDELTSNPDMEVQDLADRMLEIEELADPRAPLRLTE